MDEEIHLMMEARMCWLIEEERTNSKKKVIGILLIMVC